MNTQSASRAADRVESLDVIRGTAAFIVMLSHCIIGVSAAMPQMWERLNWTPLRIFWAGHQSVIVFFVLSGFALTCMVRGMPAYGYGRYVLARIARLYPPYILSIGFALAVFGALAAAGIQWEEGWMTVSKPHLTTPLAIGHLLMIGVFGMGDINPVVWSLVYEMRISILFPLILLAVTRYGFKAIAGFVCLSVLYWLRYGGLDWKWPATATANLLETLHYSTFFAMGAWLAINRQAVLRKVASVGRIGTCVLWIAGLALFAYSFDGSFNLGQRALSDLFVGLGSAIIVALSFELPQGRMFRFGKWLGKISYSLYLTHTPILHACLILLFARIGGIATAAIAIVLCLSFAVVFHRFVESPSIRLGRYIIRRSAPHRASKIAI